jgi:hypothetical protein
VADANKKVHEHFAISMLKERSSSYVAGEQLDWIEAKPGVHIKWLYRSPDQAHRSGLFRLEAGARSAPHDHTELEQIYGMSGSLYDGTRLLSAGDQCVRPPDGSDTQFTSLMACYNALSPTLKAFIDGLRGIHRNGSPQGVHADKEYQEKIRNRLLESEHPLVRVHPETGERALYPGSNQIGIDCRAQSEGKPGAVGTAVGTSRAPRVHCSIQVGTGQRRIPGQPRGLPSRTS